MSESTRILNPRFHELKKILDGGVYFKVVCGAGNEDPVEVERLTLIYTLAGALGIDISANVDVVHAAMRGIERAIAIAPTLGRTIGTRPFVNVSIGLAGDPHVRKATLNPERCTRCGACVEACPQDAIVEFEVLRARCIGCGKCGEACGADAIEYSFTKVDFNTLLPQCIAAGAENLELHAIIPDDDSVLRDWHIVCELVPEQFVSMCIDRSHLSNAHLKRRISDAAAIAGERLIIQADGAPMSGGADDFKTTLQAIAIAEEIEKFKISMKMLLSGGTNSRTGELAKLCGISPNGVSIGTFARRIVKPELSCERIEKHPEILTRALEKADRLVDVNLRNIAKDGSWPR